MGLFNDDELTTQLCKVGGPVLLFICTPGVAWIELRVIQKELEMGNHIELRNAAGMLGVLLFEAVLGLWMCRKGYGWFGGKKPPKPEL